MTDALCPGLKPLLSSDCKVLILGSYPSLISLKTGEYYANPKNMFWGIIEEILNIPGDLSYQQRVSHLLSRGIGLWDVYANCIRPGSSDSNISNPIPNDIRGLLLEYPGLTTIFLNGREAEKGFIRFFPDLTIKRKYLPSSSPAHAISRPEKVKQWMDVLYALHSGQVI